MIELINRLLAIDDFFNKSDNIDIAKGKYELTTSIKKTWKQSKRYKNGTRSSN